MADAWKDLLTEAHESATDPHPQYQLAVDLSWKKSVRVAATTNTTRSGPQTVDGVSTTIGDRVLLTGQTTPSQNGVWVVAASTWSRATDLNADAEFHAGIAVFVVEGSSEGGSIYYLSTTSAITVDTTSQAWSKFTVSGSGALLVSDTTTITSEISPSQITSNTNDYAPTGFSTATVLRLNTDASRDLTGIAGGSAGRTIIIFNVGSFDLVLKNQNVLSSAGNRFAIGSDITMASAASVCLWYDSTSSRWRAF